MPRKRKGYKKRNKRPGYGYGWVPTIKNATSAMGATAALWTAVRGLYKMLNVEKKFLDNQVTPAPVDKNGAVVHLSPCNQGSDYNERTGNSIKASSLYLRGYTNLPSTATTGHILRAILFIDHDNNATAPTPATFLENVEPNSPILHTEGKRYEVLRDQMIALSNTGPDIKMVKWNIKLDHHIKYSDPTTGIREGQIYLLVISDTLTVSEEPLFGYDCRIRYVDN